MNRRLSSRAARWLAALTGLVGLAGLAVAPSVRANDVHGGHGTDTPATAPSRVGVLLADHGEPPEYNAWTYESFREFFQHLIAMGIIPSWLTALETGTILYDADCPACTEPSDSPRLIDAWLRPHDGPAVFVPASESLPAHYVQPRGPGFREPDIYEHVGLGAWHEWQRMGGRSPNYEEKLAKKQAVIERLRAAYGDRLAVRVGYGIDPRLGGGRQGIREALDALVNRDRIDALVVVYHGVGFSDIMQTHHLRRQVAEHLQTLGAGHMPVRYAAPLGTTDHYVKAVVEKVRAELAQVPPEASVAIHLSGHGLSTTMCGDYDCGADAYHRYAADLFERVRPAVQEAIDRPGRTGVFQIYGDGGEGDADPENKAASPIEALDARVAEGYTNVIDIPYEFDSNSRDTLIVLRQGYRRDAPDWNAAWESQFTYQGMQVKIANASGGQTHKTEALYTVTMAALEGLVPASATPGYEMSNLGGHGPQAVSLDEDAEDRASLAEISHRSNVALPDTAEESANRAHTSGAPRFDRIGTSSNPPVGRPDDGLGDHATEADAPGTEAAAATHADSNGPSGTTGLLLALTGAAAGITGLAARRRIVAARVVLGGLGLQLAGLGWDVMTHADTGEAVHLLENAGHWVALGGLAATGITAAVLLRAPAEPKRDTAT